MKTIFRSPHQVTWWQGLTLQLSCWQPLLCLLPSLTLQPAYFWGGREGLVAIQGGVFWYCQNARASYIYIVDGQNRIILLFIVESATYNRVIHNSQQLLLTWAMMDIILQLFYK